MEVFGSERLELLFDDIKDTAIFVRQVGQGAKSIHPRSRRLAARIA